MPISAAGSSRVPAGSAANPATALHASRYAGAHRGAGQGGFTLIELMVVVAILAVTSTVVVMNMPDPRGSLLQEAERLAARAGAARDAAIIEAKPTALVLGPAGYGFSQRQRGAWVPIVQKPLGQRAWGDGVTATTAQAGQSRVIFDSTGLADPATVTLARDDMRISVAIGPDGAIDVR